MATNVPVTTWKPTDGNSEMGQSNSAFIDTESGLDIITESGVNLIIEAGTATLIPSTKWSEDDSK